MHCYDHPVCESALYGHPTAPRGAWSDAAPPRCSLTAARCATLSLYSSRRPPHDRVPPSRPVYTHWYPSRRALLPGSLAAVCGRERTLSVSIDINGLWAARPCLEFAGNAASPASQASLVPSCQQQAAFGGRWRGGLQSVQRQQHPLRGGVVVPPSCPYTCHSQAQVRAVAQRRKQSDGMLTSTVPMNIRVIRWLRLAVCYLACQCSDQLGRVEHHRRIC